MAFCSPIWSLAVDSLVKLLLCLQVSVLWWHHTGGRHRPPHFVCSHEVYDASPTIVFAGICTVMTPHWRQTPSSPLCMQPRSIWCLTYYCVCRYLYCDEISLEADTVLPTLYAAKKYMMPHLLLCLQVSVLWWHHTGGRHRPPHFVCSQEVYDASPTIVFAGICTVMPPHWRQTPSSPLCMQPRNIWCLTYYCVCRYLYCDDTTLEADTVLPTLYAAKKYMMPHLLLCLQVSVLWCHHTGGRHRPPHFVCSQEVYDAPPTIVFAGICTVMTPHWRQTPSSPLCMQPRSIWCLTYYCVCRYLYCDDTTLEADTVLPTLYAAKKYMMPHLLLCLQVSVLWCHHTGGRHRPPHFVCSQEVYDASPTIVFAGICTVMPPHWRQTPSSPLCMQPRSIWCLTYYCVCRYLYCDDTTLEADTVLPTLYAAKKYMMPHLLLCLQVSVLWWHHTGGRHRPPHFVCSQEVYDASPTIVFAGICTVMTPHWRQTPSSPLCMQPRSIWCLTYYCVCRYLYCDDTTLEADTVLPTLYAAKKYMMPHLLLCLQVSVLWCHTLEADTVLPSLYAAKKYMMPHLLLCLQVSVLWWHHTGGRHRPPHFVCSQEVYDASPTIVFAGICTVMTPHWRQTPSSPLCMQPRSIWCLTYYCVCRYLYCDEVEADTVLPTLYAAKKYMMPHLLLCLQVSVLWWHHTGGRHRPPHFVCSQEVYDASPTIVFAGICTVMTPHWRQTPSSPLCMQPRSIWCLTYYCVCRYLYCDDTTLEADTVLPTLYAAKKYMMPHLLLCAGCHHTGGRHRPPHFVCSQEVYDASPTIVFEVSVLWWHHTGGRHRPPHFVCSKKYMMPHLLLCLQVSVLWWDLTGSRHRPPHFVCSHEVYDASPTIVFAGICTVMTPHWRQTPSSPLCMQPRSIWCLTYYCVCRYLYCDDTTLEAGPSSPLCMQPRSIWCLTYYCVCRYLYCDDTTLEADTVLPTLYAAKKYMMPHLLLCLQVSVLLMTPHWRQTPSSPLCMQPRSIWCLTYYCVCRYHVLWWHHTGGRHRPPHFVCSQEVYDASPTIVFAGICTVMTPHWRQTPSSPLCMQPRSIWCLTYYCVCRYLYCDATTLEADTVLPTLYAAKKYMMPHTIVFAGICTVMPPHWRQTPSSPLCMQPRSIWCLTYYCVCRYLYCDATTLEADTMSSPLCMQPRSIWCLTYYCVCRYLYCDDTTLEADTVLPTLYAAKKYMMPHLLLCLQVSVLWCHHTGGRHRPPHFVCSQEVYDASPTIVFAGICTVMPPHWRQTPSSPLCMQPRSIWCLTYYCVCRYLYWQPDTTLEADTVLPTLYAAKKYMMPHLLLCLQVSVLWWHHTGGRHRPPHFVCSQEVYDASPTIVFAGICTVMPPHWRQTPSSPLCMQPRSIWCLTYYCVCRYLYCDATTLEADTVLPTLYAAKKYMMPHLERDCVKYLETNVDASNACLLLSNSRLFEETELMQRCLDVIDSQTEEAIQSDSFIDIDYQTLEQILVRDTLNIREAVVFAAVKRWAEAECIRQGRDTSPQQCRDVLGDALCLLRFPIMTPGEFSDGACQSGLLSDREIIDLFRHFTASSKPKLRFSTDCRKVPAPQCCRRFNSTGAGWGYSKLYETIQFSVDKSISVVGFGLYGSYGRAAENDIDITVKCNGALLGQKKQSMNSDGTANTIHVMLDRPVRIAANTYYTVTLIWKDTNTYGHCGLSGMPHVRCGDINFKFRKFPDTYSCTDVEKGQIPEILFHH